MDVIADAHERLRRFSVDDLDRLLESGVLGEEDRVELLDGLIIEMSPEGPPHAAVWSRLNEFLVRGLPDDPLTVRGGPVRFPPWSQPVPDLSIVDTTASGWDAHPDWAHLVIEVAYSSRRTDRGRKSAIYARAGVPEYWVVDLVDLCVEVRTGPSGDAFERHETLRPPAELQCAAVALPPLDLARLFAR